MAEYDLDFSKELIESAQVILNKQKSLSFNTHRTIIYFSLLSCEISLKAMLEKAGISIQEIKSCNHNFDKLLRYLGGCEIPTPYSDSTWHSASDIQSRTVVENTMGTVGLILSTIQKVSKYPNNIRYGEQIQCYSAETVLKTAEITYVYAKEYWNAIRINKERFERIKSLIKTDEEKLKSLKKGKK